MTPCAYAAVANGLRVQWHGTYNLPRDLNPAG